MKHSIKVFLFATIYLVSCNADKGTKGEETSQRAIPPFPTVIDTLKFERNDSLGNGEETTWLRTANYPFLYIGVMTDSIFVNHQLRYELHSPRFLPDSLLTENKNKQNKSHLQEYYIDWEDKRNYLYGQKSDVEIRIDTAKKINHSFPILLTNYAKDTIAIGYGDILPLIMEAKDSTGLWKPIEEAFVYMCGNGVGTIILPPNEVVLSYVPITNGNYSTELRIVFGENHSEPFKGNINYRQFESRYDERGNYKEEYKREEREGNATNH